jgi:hypothetical protein
MGDTIVLVDEIFNAGRYVKEHDGAALDIDLLRVSLTEAFEGPISSPFYPGGRNVTVSGVIRRVEIDTCLGDMFKVLKTCENLTIGQEGDPGAGGYILANGKLLSKVHQNVQVQGGTNVLFKNVDIYSLYGSGANCVYMNGSEIESVVFDGCDMITTETGVWSTFDAGNCRNSGLRHCRVTPRSKGKFAIRFSKGSISPVDVENEILPPEHPRIFPELKYRVE